MALAEYLATFALSEDAMSLNAISSSLATLGVTSTSSSIASADLLPGNFAEFLAAQTLQATTLVGVDSKIPSELSASDDSTNLDIAIAEEGPAIDPSLLAGLVVIPAFKSPTAIENNTNRPQNNLGDEGFMPSADSLENHLLSLKDKNESEIPAAANKPLNAVFGDFEQQLLSKKAEAANIAADASTGVPSAANFESVMTKATQTHTTGAHTPLTVNPTLASDAWPSQFSEKIVWLAKNEQQSAQININPPQLGPIQITLNLNGDQMNAAFTSPHAEVRQAIESALPQLRDMLSTAGIALGDTNVGGNFARHSQDNPFQAGNKTQSLGENAILPADENAANLRSSPVILKGRGLVDLFA